MDLPLQMPRFINRQDLPNVIDTLYMMKFLNRNLYPAQCSIRLSRHSIRLYIFFKIIRPKNLKPNIKNGTIYYEAMACRRWPKEL
jgi:hypothetical protein